MSFNLALAHLSEEELQFIIKNGKRSSVICGFDFEGLIYSSFKYVKETVPELIKNSKFEQLIYEGLKDRGVGLFLCDVQKEDYNDLLYFLFWIIDEMQLIAKMEKEYLSSDPDVKLISAGIQRLDQFGNINLIDNLAGGDILKWEQVKNMPYHLIFDKQYKSIIESDIQKKLLKMK